MYITVLYITVLSVLYITVLYITVPGTVDRSLHQLDSLALRPLQVMVQHGQLHVGLEGHRPPGGHGSASYSHLIN